MSDASVIVIGGGTMGAGIAQVMLGVADRVTVVESSAELADAALGRVADGLLRQHKRAADPVASVRDALGRFGVSVGLPADAVPTLVVEAVPESTDLKRAVFTDIEAAYPELPVLASNTSSLSIDDLAATLARPERFVGMHFFNPVPLSDLVEIVVGRATSDATLASARRWVAALAKESITVHDAPGFATSRLGVALGLEAIRMVEAGVASADDIDRGMVLGYKHPMGPLRLTDLVGLDVRLGIAEHLATSLGSRFEPPPLLRSMVAEGRLGKKTGQGFYTWPA
jgi:3-hydroxybutyryl-CoA dehydrogenase